MSSTRCWRHSSRSGNERAANLSLLPEIFRVRQTFAGPQLADVAGTVRAELARLQLQHKIHPGQSVAVTAGSRGIAYIVVILRTIVEHLQGLGGRPFLVPAMGSHAGGTAAGQSRLLESYGITEAAVGCPIRSSTETVVVCQAAEGFPVHFDRLASQADHVLVCGRVKPHTSLAGTIESGLLKMLLVGLGKCEGAKDLPPRDPEPQFRSNCPQRRRRGDREVPCPGRPGHRRKCLRPDGPGGSSWRPGFLCPRRQLLLLARQWLPQLPFRQVDLLLMDKIGKDISGVGFDPNVVGRKFNDHQAVEGEYPKVKRIALRRLSRRSLGNAIGIGLAEFCRSQLFEQADFAATRLNVLTSGRVSAAMCPLDYQTDRQMLEAALGTAGLVEPPQARLLWIADTLHLAEVECSAAYLDEARSRSDLTILTAPRPLPLDASGNLPDWDEPAD